LSATEFEIDNCIISDFILRTLIPIVGVRPFPLNELQLMVGAVCRFSPTHIFEWGTHIGKSARVFYETVREFHIPAQIHSVDLPEQIEHVEHPHRKRGLLVRGKAGVFLHVGDGLTDSLRLLSAAGNSCVPLFFVDGDHEYSSVHRELTAILREAPNAAILAHDTFFQSPESGYNVGPHKAIQDVLAAQPRGRRTLSTATGVPGMTLIY